MGLGFLIWGFGGCSCFGFFGFCVSFCGFGFGGIGVLGSRVGGFGLANLEVHGCLFCGGVTKVGASFVRVPIVRLIVFGCLRWGPLCWETTTPARIRGLKGPTPGLEVQLAMSTQGPLQACATRNIRV